MKENECAGCPGQGIDCADGCIKPKAAVEIGEHLADSGHSGEDCESDPEIRCAGWIPEPVQSAPRKERILEYQRLVNGGPCGMMERPAEIDGEYIANGCATVFDPVKCASCEFYPASVQPAPSEEDALIILKAERNLVNHIRAKFKGDSLGHGRREQKRHWQLPGDEPAQILERYVQQRIAEALRAQLAEQPAKKILNEALDRAEGFLLQADKHLRDADTYDAVPGDLRRCLAGILDARAALNGKEQP